MKPSLLLPRYFRPIGWILGITGIILGLLFEFDDRYLPFLDYNGGRIGNSIPLNGGNNFTDEVATTLSIFGLLFIGFSKFKAEEQYAAPLRLKALYWAVLVNAGIAFFLMMGVFQRFHCSNFAINNSLILLLLIFIGRLYFLRFTKEEQTNLFYLPHRPFSLIGKIITIIFIIAIFIVSAFDFKPAAPDFTPYLILPCILLWICSKEKHDGQETETLRLKAMQLSIYINYTAFIILTWTVYGFNYLAVQFAALVSVQAVFIITFYILIFKAGKSKVEGLISRPVMP